MPCCRKGGYKEGSSEWGDIYKKTYSVSYVVFVFIYNLILLGSYCFLLFFAFNCIGTVKEAVLEGVADMNNIVSCYVYDTDTVQFI